MKLIALALIGFAAASLLGEQVDVVNAAGSTWHAETNKFSDMSVEEAKQFLGLDLSKPLDLPIKATNLKGFVAAESFDARDEWSQCSSIGNILDQGRCGSCWAFGATEALSDRFCTQSGGDVQVQLSPQYLVSCDDNNFGCNGGYLDKAWNFMKEEGVVDQECFPYTSGQSGSEPPCPQGECPGTGDFKKYKASSVVQLPSDVASIQEELSTNGPLEVAFMVYQDFMSYAGGVYQHTSGGFLGGHAVKLIGWGVEDGTPYWLCANSWGTTWGESGYFKILRGADECEIEDYVIGGAADLSAHEGNTFVVSESIVEDVNSKASTWTAAASTRFEGMTVEQAKKFLGTKLDRKPILPERNHLAANDIPASFDASQEWSQCATIGTILDQGRCGSCWAFGATEALSDRFCIQSGVSVQLAPQDPVSCDNGNFGCNGGYLDKAWNYMRDEGVVVETCFPYTSGQSGSEPPCPQGTCPGTGDFQKFKASSAYSVPSSVEQIQTEIMTNGPVETGFSVYQDFMSYSGGVYQHTSGGLLGGHAVKIIGWGEEDGTPYWLVNNSWGTTWGESGQFKILRGSDECQFESNVVAGMAGDSVAL